VRVRTSTELKNRPTEADRTGWTGLTEKFKWGAKASLDRKARGMRRKKKVIEEKRDASTSKIGGMTLV